MEIKVMTYNILHGKNYLTQEIDLSLIAQIIKEQDPDYIGLNEVYQGQEAIIASMIGYHSYFGQAIEFKNQGFGNAILSKNHLEDFKVVMIPDPIVFDEDVYYETRNILTAFDPINQLQLYVTHVGLARSEAINAIKTLKEIIKPQQSIILGDFNLLANNPILKPLELTHQDTNLNIDKLTTDQFTFSSTEPNRKIDYIWASHDLKVLDGRPIQVIASDHFPYLAKIKK